MEDREIFDMREKMDRKINEVWVKVSISYFIMKHRTKKSDHILHNLGGIHGNKAVS